LVSGEGLVSADGKDAEVVAVESRAERVAVYNLAVARMHTYFVGTGVWVHNVCNFTQPHDTTIQTLTTNNTNKPVVIPPQTMQNFIQNSTNIDDQYKPALIEQAGNGKPIVVQPAGA